MVLWLILLGYYVFGFLLMDFMCPYWGMFGKMIGAIIWPVSLAIGIWIMVREGSEATCDDQLRRNLEMLVNIMEEDKRLRGTWTPNQNDAHQSEQR